MLLLRPSMSSLFAAAAAHKILSRRNSRPAWTCLTNSRDDAFGNSGSNQEANCRGYISLKVRLIATTVTSVFHRKRVLPPATLAFISVHVHSLTTVICKAHCLIKNFIPIARWESRKARWSLQVAREKEQKGTKRKGAKSESGANRFATCARKREGRVGARNRRYQLSTHGP